MSIRFSEHAASAKVIQMPARISLLVISLLLCLAIQVVTSLQHRGPAAKSLDAPADEFSAARAFAVLERLLGDEQPHPAGSPANARVRERLVAEFTELDIEVEVLPFESGKQQLNNLLATLPNSPSEGQPLVLASHYDSVGAGPGAADAGAGVAAILETARILRRESAISRPVYFLITDAEEAGLVGANAFVGSHRLAQENPFVLNFEARGTSGPSMMFETHRGNLAAARIVSQYLPRPCVTGSSFVTIYRFLPNDTDFTIFQEDGWTGLNFAFADDAHNYHSANDSLANLNLRSLQHHGDNALSISRGLATEQSAELGKSDEDAVFFDILTLFVLAYPKSWAMPLAVVATSLLVIRFAKQLYSTRFWCDALWVLATVAVALLSAAVIGEVAAQLLSRAGFFPRNFAANSGYYVAIFIPISLLVTWGAARMCLRGIAVESAWIQFWIGWSLAGCALSAAIPGFSYYTLLPALSAALLGLLPLSFGLRAIVAAGISAILFIPLANLMILALGPLASLIYLPIIFLVWLPFLPLMVRENVQESNGKPNNDLVAS